MACSGCIKRRQNIVEASKAIKQGRFAEAKGHASTFARSAQSDIARKVTAWRKLAR